MTCANLPDSGYRDGPGPGYRGHVLGAGWTEAVALAAAFIVSAIATPAGISGAVLLLPFQVSVLINDATRSPAARLACVAAVLFPSVRV